MGKYSLKFDNWKMSKLSLTALIYGLCTCFLLGLLGGFVIGAFYQRQISEVPLQAERLRTARVRFQDWTAFVAHLSEDRRHPDRRPLTFTGARDLKAPILSKPFRTAKPGCE